MGNPIHRSRVGDDSIQVQQSLLYKARVVAFLRDKGYEVGTRGNQASVDLVLVRAQRYTNVRKYCNFIDQI